MSEDGGNTRQVENWELGQDAEGPTARRSTSTGSWVTGVSLLGLLLIFVLVLQFGEDPRMAQGVPVHALWMGMSFFVAFLAMGFVFFVLRKPNLGMFVAVPCFLVAGILGMPPRGPMGKRLPPEQIPRVSVETAAGVVAVLPFGGLALGFILGGIEQRLSWRRSDGRVFWVLQWGLGTTRKEWHHDELRAFRFEDHLVEYRTKHGKQTMEFGRLYLMAQDGSTTELVSSGGLLETRKAAEALAEHFDLAHSSWVVRDGKVSASSEGGLI